MYNQTQNLLQTQLTEQQRRITIEEKASLMQVITNTTINSSPQKSIQTSESIVVRRPEVTEFAYDLTKTYRYTSKLRELGDNLGFKRSEFSLHDIKVEKCEYHTQWKDYILVQEVPPHPKYTVMCNVCYEELRRQKKGAHLGESYLSIIYASGDKIAQIKNNKINFGTYTNAFTSSTFMHSQILPLADELIDMAETFEESVIHKMCGLKFSEDDLLTLKNWINTLELDQNNNPNTREIGKHEELMKNYVKLAVFLSTFEGLGSGKVDTANLTENLKQHILRMIQLRKLIVVRITDWIKYLTGDFYKFLFSIEGVQVDFNFIQSLTIEFGGNDQEAFFLKEEIRRRDVTIKQLKEENEVLRSKLSENELNFSEDWEGKYWEIKSNYEKLQGEINNLNVIIQNLQIENKRLVEINMNMNNQLTILQQEIKNIEINVTNKYTVIINNMKAEFERRIIEIRETIIRERDSYWERQIIVIRDQGEGEWRRKYEELWALYKNLEIENKNLKVQINEYRNEINGCIEKYEKQLIIFRELEQQLIVIREQRNKVEYVEREKIVYVDKPVEKLVKVEKIIVKTNIRDVVEIVERPIEVPVSFEKIVYVEKPVEKIVYVDKLVEKIVYIDKPYPVEKIVEKIIVKNNIRDVVEVVDRPVEVPVPFETIVYVEKPVEKIVYVDKLIEKIVYVDKPYPVEKIVEKILVKNNIRDVVEVVERPVEVPVEKIVYVDKPYPVEKLVYVDKIIEKVIVKNNIRDVVEIVDRPVEVPVEKIVYVDKPYPVERMVYVDKIIEKIIVKNNIRDVVEIVEKPIEIPVEKIVYVDKPYPVEKIVVRTDIKEIIQIVDRPVEVPVEKIVYVDKPYPVETIIEKIIIKSDIIDVVEVVEKPIEIQVEKLIYVDRPVEKIVYVDKPVDKIVYVEKIVEKIIVKNNIRDVVEVVERPVEVQVEKIVYVDKPYSVEKIVEKLVVKSNIRDVVEIIEKPIEKIVYVDKPYPLEKIIEKIIVKNNIRDVVEVVEKPVEVQVEKIVFVDKPYPVEKIVVRTDIKDIIKIVDRPVEVPVEKIVYVDKPYPVEKIVEVIRVETKIVEKPYIVKEILEVIRVEKDETEIIRLRGEINNLKQRMSTMSIDITTWNSEWEKLHTSYLILLEDIKKQVAKNEYLSTLVIELETTIERYNSTVVGSEAYLKQQLELIARSSLKNQSLAYVSHRKEITDTQSELFNLRKKIGRIEAVRFNKSAVHQHFSYNQFEQSSSGQQVNYFQQVGKTLVEKKGAAYGSSVDLSKGADVSIISVANVLDKSIHSRNSSN